MLLTLLLWFLSALFGVFYLLYSCYTGRWKRRLWLHLPLILVPVVPEILCKTAIASDWFDISDYPLPFDPFAPPVWAVAAVAGSLVLLQTVLLLRDRRLRKEQITRLSIKESVEQLPAALCFSAKGGMPILSNHNMNALSFALQGRALLNADVFWQSLPQETVRTPDGSVWAFRRDTIQLDDETVTQTVGIPITDLDNLRRELQQKNDALLQNNRRLRQYSREMEALTREQEIFSTKSRIHNEIGGVLLQTRHALTHTAPLPADALLEQWYRLISMLEEQKPPEREGETLFAQFKQAAQSIDVKVVLHGFLPADPQVRRLIVAVGKQALTNAVRHANASTLTLQIDDRSDGYTVRYTNDGDPPRGPIVPGGGLSEAETLAERSGGWLSVRSQPDFCLTLFIPYTGGDGNVSRDGGGRPGDAEETV